MSYFTRERRIAEDDVCKGQRKRRSKGPAVDGGSQILSISYFHIRGFW
jgi:hypothetical protein